MPLAQVSLATFLTSKPAKENARPQAEDSDEDAFTTKPPPSSTLQKPSAEPPAASPGGAGPSGATKSAERAAADMAVRTKPPPGWRTAPAADVAAPRLSARQARAPARLDPAEEQERSRQRASGSAVGKRRADEYAVQRIIEEQVSARPRTVIAFEPWAISSPLVLSPPFCTGPEDPDRLPAMADASE